MTISSKNQANHQNTLRRTATWQVAIITILFVAMAVNATLLALERQIWQGAALATLGVLRTLFALFGLYQIRQNKIDRGIFIIIGAISITSFLTGLLVAGNIGLILATAVLLSVAFLASSVLSGHQRRNAFILGGVFSLLTGLTNFLPLPFRVIAPVQTQSLGGFVTLLVVLLAYFVIRGYGKYPLNIKLSAGFLVVVFSAIGIMNFVINSTLQQSLLDQIGDERVIIANTEALIIANELSTQLDVLETFILNNSMKDRLVIAEAVYATSTDIDAALADAEASWQAADDLDPIVQSRLTNLLALELQDFQNGFPQFRELFITDRYGALVAAAARPEQYAFADESWWQTTFSKNAGESFVGQPTEGEDEGELFMTMAVPVLIEEQVVGVLHAAYTMGALEELVEASRVGDTGVAEIYLPSGQELELENGEQEIEDSEFAIDEIDISGTEAFYLEIEYDDVPSIVAFAPIAGNTDEPSVAELDWTVVFHQQKQESLAPLQAQQNVLAGLIVGIALVALLVSIWLSRLLSNPINDLIQITNQIRAGDYSVRSRVDTGDELQTLGDTFNQMAAHLQQTLGDLQVRNTTISTSADISRQLSTILDQTQLVANVVMKLQSTFDYYHVQIYLFDEAHENLVMVGGTGNAGQEMLAQGHKISKNKGLVGHAASTSQTVLAPDVSQRSDWQPNSLLPDTKSEIAVPILVGDKVQGVLDAQQNRVDSLGQRDAELLQSIANQVGIALQNAKQFSELQHSQRTIRERETLLRTIIDSTPDWVFVKNLNHRYMMVNQGYANSFGISPEEFVGKNDLDIGFPEEIVKGNPEKGIRGFWADDREIMERGEMKVIDVEPAVVDGEERFLNTIKAPLKDAAGNVIGVVGFVHDITELQNIQTELAKHAAELETVAKVSSATANILEPDQLLQQVVNLTKTNFGLYHVHIHMLNDRKDTLVLTAGAGEVGQKMVAEGRRIPLASKDSLVATVARTRQGAIRNYDPPGEGFMPHLLLAETRSEMAVPIVLGEDVLGVLDMRSDELNYFDAADMQAYITLSAQIAIALQNAYSFTRSEQALKEMGEFSRRLTREGWANYMNTVPTDLHVSYGLLSDEEAEGEATLSLPLQVQGATIGQLTMVEPQILTDEAANIVREVGERLGAHIENLRLTAQTEQALAGTEALYKGSDRVVRAETLDGVLEAVVDSTYLKQFDRNNIILFDPPWDNQKPQFALVAAVQRKDGKPPLVPVGTQFKFEQFPVADMFSRTKPVFFDDITTDEGVDENFRKVMAPLKTIGLAIFPLVAGGQWIGVVMGQSNQSTSWSEQQVRQTLSLTDQAATVIQSMRLYDVAQTRAQHEQTLREVTARIHAAPDAKSVLRTAAQEVNRAMGLEAFVYLEEPELEKPLNGDEPAH